MLMTNTMTVKELKTILAKYDDNDMIDITLSTYNGGGVTVEVYNKDYSKNTIICDFDDESTLY